MNKHISLLLAVAMAFGLSGTAFAGISSVAAPSIPIISSSSVPQIGAAVTPRSQNGVLPTATPGAPTPTATPNGSNIIYPDNVGGTGGTQTQYHLSVGPNSNNVVYNQGMPFFYTYGPKTAGNTLANGGKQAKIGVIPEKGYKIFSAKGRAETKNVYANAKTGTVAVEGGTAQGAILTVSSNAAANVREPQDYEVSLELQIGTTAGVNKQWINITLEGTEAVAYSKMRLLEDGDRETVSTTSGSVFELDGSYSSSTRIRCATGANVYIKGNHSGYVNMVADEEPVAAIEKLFPNGNVEYYNFLAKPSFRTSVKVELEANSDCNVYSYDAKTGVAKKLTTTESGGYLSFTAKQLGWYFVAEGEPVKKTTK